MINISKSGNAIKFVFTDSDHYLYGNGEIEVPVNSLSLIVDESNMVTFRKANSNDIFLSFDPANSNLSDKAGVINFYKTEMVGSTGGGSESGITSGDVQTMIDNSLEDYYTDDEVDAALSGKADASNVYTIAETNYLLNDLSQRKADTSAVTAVASDVSALSGQVATKVNATDFNAYSAATDARLAEDEEVTAAALNNLNENKQDALTAGQGIDITNNVISSTVNITVDPTLDTGSTNPVANSAITTAIDNAKAYYISFATIATTGIRDEDWDGIVAAIDDHRPIYAGYPRNNGGILYYGVECMNKNGDNTQIVLTSSDDNSHYFYTFTKNGSNDYTFTSETRPYTTQAEKDSWNAKQDALSAGTGIEISGNVISATGGGGMDDDTQQLISTAFNDLNDRKADLTELTKYQKKGDYVETPTLADYMTNDAFDEYATAKERIISGALNDLNDKFGGLRLVKISQADYDALTEKSENTLYIINNVI